MTLTMHAFPQTAMPPSVGDGSESNPYEISTLENLYWLTQSDTAWSKHYIQTVDIDASSSIAWDNDSGFTPIGNNKVSFTGSYNGKGHIIDNVFINRLSDYDIGLFGRINNSKTKIDSIGLTNVSIKGNRNVGTIAGYVLAGKISNSFSTGNCTAISIVSWAQAGGFIGYNNLGVIYQCFTSVNVDAAGFNNVGGFIGPNRGKITNCYSMGEVNGLNSTGGFVGTNYDSGQISNCYSTGNVIGSSATGGFVGLNYDFGRIYNSFWNTETSGQITSDGGTGLTTLEMQDSTKYLNMGWDLMDETINGIEDVWGFNCAENNGYPFLNWQGYTNIQGCQAPFSPVSGIVFGDISLNSINFERITKFGFGTSGYSIYINNEDNWIVPVDGTEPVADISWQNNGQQCIYFGTSNNPNITVTGLSENTKYYFKVYAYNNCSEIEIYEQTGAGIIQATEVFNTVPFGDGSKNNPFNIANLDNLIWLMYNDTSWDKHFIQTVDIDASASINWDNDQGFTPIGNSMTAFVGSYNAKGHIIDQITINRPDEDYIGLFGKIDNAYIDSLGLTNTDITGNNYVGSIAGHIYEGEITNCFTAGTCTVGDIAGGGLCGFNGGQIKFCYSNVNVNSAGDQAGGFAGVNNGNITHSYSRGSVDGNAQIGGFIGFSNEGAVTSCFWDKETSGQSTSDGSIGLTTVEMQDLKTYLKAGWDFIDESYNGIEGIWGLNSDENEGYPFLQWQGYTNMEILECQAPLYPADDIIFGNIFTNDIILKSFTKSGYGTSGYAIYINNKDTWVVPADGTEPSADTSWQNNGQQCIYFGTSNNPNVIIAGLSENTRYYFKVYAYNDCSEVETYEQNGAVSSQFTDISVIVPVGEGSLNNPFIIDKLQNLVWLMHSDTVWSKHFIQTVDIDASSSVNWDEGKGFIPIGNVSTTFTGSYNGGGHIISGININRNGEFNIGLFGYLQGNARIENLGLTNLEVIGGNSIGGLVGIIDSDEIDTCLIIQCFSQGNVTGNFYVGGLVGSTSIGNEKIINCYTKGTVDANSAAGGLLGKGRDLIIQNCYSNSKVSATYSSGGLIGSTYNCSIENCFWDIETSGQSSSMGGGTGLTTVDMQGVKSYLIAGWDFMDETYNGTEDIWGLNSSENNGYPFLQWQGYTNEEIFECQAPLSSASSIVLENILGNNITLQSFIKSGYGTSGYSIYINTVDNWVVPVDGSEPDADTSWQNNGQQCIYFGASNNPDIIVTGLSELTEYYFKVYAYNDCSGIETYEQTGTVTSEITDISVMEPDGEGSTSNPYVITTCENLAWLMRSDTVWDKHFIQTTDIDLLPCIDWDEGRGFTPIGNSTTVFSGSYNGKGHIIDNIYINRQTDSLIGLFGKTNNAYIDSLGITNINIKGSKHVGGLVGNFSGGQITNCYTTGTCISNNSDDWRAIIGGLAGYSNGKISSCYSNVDVSSGYGIVGGLVGSNADTLIQSHSQGNVTGNSFTGGLVGYNTAIISFCFSDVYVRSSSDYVGGLVGVNEDVISCSYSSGTVIGNNYSGGLAGINEGRVSFCYSDVIVSSNYEAIGGLVGLNADFISCSYSTGNVAGNNYVGGFVGVNLDFIIHCYSKSNINANNLFGGFTGDNYGYIISSFWDKEITGLSIGIGGEGLTTSNMRNIKSYFNAGWDFMDETTNGTDDYWGLNSSENYGYPFLYWQGYTNTATIPTDINGIENTDISIYPNPVSEVLNITTSDEGINRLVITDINGKKIIERNVINRNEQIDMSSFNSGIYIMNIYKGNEVYTSKIIKK
jgi:hypothetical protein